MHAKLYIYSYSTLAQATHCTSLALLTQNRVYPVLSIPILIPISSAQHHAEPPSYLSLSLKTLDLLSLLDKRQRPRVLCKEGGGGRGWLAGV